MMYLLISEFSSPFGNLNIGLLQDNVGIPSTNTFDGSDGKHNFDPSINVGVEDTQNMLKLFWYNQRLQTETNRRIHVRNWLEFTETSKINDSSCTMARLIDDKTWI